MVSNPDADHIGGFPDVFVIAPPRGELSSETNDNSVAILSYGTAHVLLAGDAETREEYLAVLY